MPLCSPFEVSCMLNLQVSPKRLTEVRRAVGCFEPPVAAAVGRIQEGRGANRRREPSNRRRPQRIGDQTAPAQGGRPRRSASRHCPVASISAERPRSPPPTSSGRSPSATQRELGEGLYVEDFLETRGELQGGDGVACGQLDHADAALQLVVELGDRRAPKIAVSRILDSPTKARSPWHRQSAGVARQGCDDVAASSVARSTRS